MSDSSQFPRFIEPDGPVPGPVAGPTATALVPRTAMAWEVPPTPGETRPWSATNLGPAGPAGSPPRRRAPSATALVVALVAVAVVAFLVGGNMKARSMPSAVGVATPSSPLTGDGASSPPSSDGSVSAPNGSAATSASFNGIVDITTELGFQNGKAAGTGMVLTASGEVLTNNHVIQGSTRIAVTAVDTGRTYTAHVVGTDPTEDVAVIQLDNASKLSTVTTTNSSTVGVGDPVLAVGNAGGKGGTPSAVTGSVVAVGQSITASDEGGANAERLTDLIEVDAPIEAGDSGGPLFNDSGEVIGMDSAAEVSRSRVQSTTAAGYAIPIGKALTIAKLIESGKASSTIHIGLPGFLGVQIAATDQGAARGVIGGGTTSASGATVAGVEPGTPAAAIGLEPGDTIVSVNGHAVPSASALSTLLGGAHPGDKVSIGWTDASGIDQTAKATLATGPAD